MLSELFDEKALREQYDIALAAECEARGEARGEAKGEARLIKTLMGLVKKGILTVSQAADEAEMTVAEFEAKTRMKTT